MENKELQTVFLFLSFRFDLKKQILTYENQPILLTPKEFEILQLLIENADGAVSKDELLEKVWQDAYVEEGTLARNISWLRKKLADYTDEKIIETLPKKGYRFLPEVTVAEPIQNQSSNLPVAEENTVNSRWFGKPLFVLVTIGLLFAFGFFWRSYSTPKKQIESVAVLPFVNKSKDSEIEYLSDGLTETLIKNLARMSNLNVKSRSSIFHYKGKSDDLGKIAAELNVQAVISGEVVQQGDDLIVNLELIDPNNGNLLWSNSYKQPRTNVLLLQNEIARDVSNQLKAKLSESEKSQIGDSGTTNPEAYRLYLKGLFVLNSGLLESQPKSIEYFQNAVALDPNFALGYVGIADSYTLLSTLNKPQISLTEAMPKARAAAEKAIELNPDLSEAYTSLGWIKFRFDWDWAAAEENFKKAIALNPKNSQAHQWYGEFLSALNRHDEAISEIKIARDLEPISVIIQWNLGKNLYIARRYDEALTELNKAIEMNPNFSRAYIFLRYVYTVRGMEKEAFDALLKENFNRFNTDQDIILRNLFQQKGFQAASRQVGEWRLQSADKDNETSFNRALFYRMTGDKPAALKMLEKGYNERVGAMVGIYSTPTFFEWLKDEPRFQELLRKMKFPLSN